MFDYPQHAHQRQHPSDLPNITKLHPPDGTPMPSGLSASFFERRRRGELPALFDGLEPAR